MRGAARLACGLLALLLGAAPAAAAPSAGPTADTAAPTPTFPHIGGPPVGTAPDGSTVGGVELKTRGTVQAVGTANLPGGLDAVGFVVADFATGNVLAAKDPHGRFYPASTMKTLQMITLYPKLDPNQVLTATYEDVTVEGSRVGLVEHGQYTVFQLWMALMMQSGNDASLMLSKAAGGVPQTLALMNEKARSLQAYDTVVGNPSGLDVAGQSSSPYDLCLFMREIVRSAPMLAIAQQRLTQLPAVPPKYPNPMTVSNNNKLLSGYSSAIAAKAGFTDAARYTYVAAAQRGERLLLVSIMQAETTSVLPWKQVAALFEWGFATPANASGAGVLVDGPPPASHTAAASSSTAAAVSSSAAASSAPDAAGRAEPVDRATLLWTLLGAAVLIGGLGWWRSRRRA